MFPKKVYYGLRFILALAVLPEGKLRGVSEIAENEDLPLKFLEAIAVSLRKNGIVDVKRGAGGGYSLAKPLENITLYDIASVLDEKIEKPIESGPSNAEKAVGLYFEDFKVSYVELLKSYTMAQLKKHYKEDKQYIMYYI